MNDSYDQCLPNHTILMFPFVGNLNYTEYTAMDIRSGPLKSQDINTQKCMHADRILREHFALQQLPSQSDLLP